MNSLSSSASPQPGSAHNKMDNSYGSKKPVCRYFMNTGDCFYGDDCSFLHDKDGQQSIANFNNLFDKTADAGLILGPFGQQIPSESKLSGYLNDIKLDGGSTPQSVGSNKILNAEKKPFMPSRNYQSLAGLDQPAMSNHQQKRQNSGNSANYFVFNDDIKLEALKKNNFLSNLNNGEMFTEIPGR